MKTVRGVREGKGRGSGGKKGGKREKEERGRGQEDEKTGFKQSHYIQCLPVPVAPAQR